MELFLKSVICIYVLVSVAIINSFLPNNTFSDVVDRKTEDAKRESPNIRDLGVAVQGDLGRGPDLILEREQSQDLDPDRDLIPDPGLDPAQDHGVTVTHNLAHATVS